MKTQLIPLILFILFSTFINSYSQIVISGKVTDIEKGIGIKDVTINTFVKGEGWLKMSMTNGDGRFGFETNLKPGQVIRIEFSKEGYLNKEPIEHTIKEPNAPGGNYILISLTELENSQTTISGFILDKKTGEGVEGVNIFYLTKSKIKYDVGQTTQNGLFTFRTNQGLGQTIYIYADKTPIYRLATKSYLIEDRYKDYRIFLKKKKKFGLEWYTFTVGGGLLITSYFTKQSSDDRYQLYKDFSNINRESDYDKANSLHKLSRASLYSGAAVVGAGLVYLFFIKNKQNKLSKNDTGFYPIYHSDDSFSDIQIGIAYNF